MAENKGATMTQATPKQRPRLLVCSCQDTMRIDADTLAKGLGLTSPPVIHRDLCRGQLDVARRALGTSGPIQIACTQEAPLFQEVATEGGRTTDDVTFTNIRERAGWSQDAAATTPKMAALLAAALAPATPTRTLTLTSEGRCLVIGPGQVALDAAAKLSARMSVTVMLTDTADALPPATGACPIIKGRIKTATGRLGAYELEIDGFAAALPSSRGKIEFEMARNGAKSNCDVIVDLSGGKALFSEHARRDGYLRANPTDRAAIAEAIFTASDLTGEFEKPLYVKYNAGICAHSRSGKTGCSKCLNVCPTGAITPDGDHVAIDPAICAGCGNCAAVCPTGAASYAYPAQTDVLARLKVLLETYARAGGTNPVLLIHDDGHGRPLIDVIARTGQGLPANVLPFEVYAATNMSHDTMAAALALGADNIVLLGSPKNAAEHESLETEIALLDAVTAGLGYQGRRATLVATDDPDVLAGALTDRVKAKSIGPIAFAIGGTKRDTTRTVMTALHAHAPQPTDWLALPKGAPYGRIKVKQDGCTLCLACVGACPANALADNPDRPELSFTEAACVQCGICVATCPENVITIEPGYNFTTSALTPTVMKTEEPFHCISCNKPFGTKSTINRVVEKLEGKHAMFKNKDQVRLIQMCDNCRVVALSESGNDPMKLGTVPRVHTTQDYLDAEATGKTNVEADTKAGGTPSANPNAKPKTPDDFLS